MSEINHLNPERNLLMINFLYRLFLTFNSTSLIIVIFLVKNQVTIKWLDARFFAPDYISYILYLLTPVIFTYISLLLANLLAEDSIEKENNNSVIKEVELANNAFLPSYLGYFFVALSIPLYETLIFIFIILFIFTFFSQSLYFNPLFLLFGYQFYYLTTSNNVRIFLITKKSFKNPNEINLPHLKRINDFTFLDLRR